MFEGATDKSFSNSKDDRDMDEIRQAVLECMEVTGMTVEDILHRIFGEDKALNFTYESTRNSILAFRR